MQRQRSGTPRGHRPRRRGTRWVAAICTGALALGCEDGGASRGAGTPSATGGPSAPAATASAPAAATGSGSAPPARTCPTPCPSIERCDGAAGRCVPACPAGEIYVPPTGPEGFRMGVERKSGFDTPHRVVLTKPFCMDATEVTAGAYAECVKAGKCAEPRLWGLWSTYPGLPDHPVNKVDWNHSRIYCEFRGKSLPTEAQWEWAATGGDGRKWAWGNEEPDCDRADFTPGPLETW